MNFHRLFYLEESTMNVEMIIKKTQAERINRTHTKDHSALIGNGGYVSPLPHLWEDLLLSVVLQKNVLLKGPSGSGKTKLAESISSYFQQPMHSINCSVDLDAEALLGFKTLIQDNGQTAIEFVEGPVIQAMRHGHILYIDEINMAKPETLPILHSVLDHRRMLTNPFTGEVLHAHPDFTVIAAINEGYIGTSPLNEALKNRFISFSIHYLTGEPLRALFEREFPNAEHSLISMMLNLAEDLVIQVQNGLLSEEAASIRSLLDATELAQYIHTNRAISYAIAEKLDDDSEKELILELAKTWLK